MRRFRTFALVLLIVLLFALPVFAEEESSVNFGWLSLLPPLLAIILAFV